MFDENNWGWGQKWRTSTNWCFSYTESHYWDSDWEGTTHASTSLIWIFFHPKCCFRSSSFAFAHFFHPSILPFFLSLSCLHLCLYSIQTAVSQDELVLTNVMEARKGLQRCRVLAEDCPIHHKPHHRFDPLNRLLLGFLGYVFAGDTLSLFDLSFLSIASADWESVFKTSWFKSNLTQSRGRCCIRAPHITFIYFLCQRTSENEGLVKQNPRICQGSVYFCLWMFPGCKGEKRWNSS